MTRYRLLGYLGAVILLALTGAAHASTSTVTYVYTDPQGTPLAEADASGNITATYDYAPYGSQAMGTPPSGPGYTGHVNDPESGLVYMQARYYDPSVGRFLSTDPVGPGAGDVFTFNRFAYVDNNPIMHTDPTGKFADTDLHVEANGSLKNLNCKATFCVVGASATGGNNQPKVANPRDYTTRAPSSISQITHDPTVRAYENKIRGSKAFNDENVRARHEEGAFVYTNNANGSVKLLNMPPAIKDGNGLYSSILAGEVPALPGFTARTAIHSHVYPVPGGRDPSLRSEFPIIAYPQPSQADVDYVNQKKIDGIVISHSGDYYIGISVSKP